MMLKFGLVLACLALADASLKVTRSSRDARHPTEIEVEVQLPNANKTVRIPLLRTDEFESMPVTVMDKGASRTFSARQLHHASHAHYNDIESKSVLSVREVNGQKQFAGHFTHEGRTYFVEPQAQGHNIRANPITAEQLQQHLDEQKVKKQVARAVSRKRRSAGCADGSAVIEIAVCLDSTVYKTFYDLYKERSLTEIHMYYTHIMNGIKISYSNIKTPSVCVVPVSLTVSISPESDSWMPAQSTPNRLDGSVILQTLAAYKKTLINQPDHVMAFTRLDITGGGSSSVCGMAYLGGVCNDNGVSINEDQGLQSWGTAAHELAHNLNSPHDAGSADCDANLHKIMAPTSGFYTLDNVANSYHFSPCSVNKMKAYIASLEPNSCLKQMTGSETGDLSKSQKAGVHYSLDQGCRMAYPNSPGKFFLSSEAKTNPALICAQIYCTKSDGGGTSRGGLRAPEGTQCGDKKSCNALGKCTDDSNAPSADPTCFWGDAADAATCKYYTDTLTANVGIRAQYCPQLIPHCCKSLKSVCS